MNAGDVDGHGRHGILSVVDDGEGVVCHECGAVRRTLGTHLRLVHGSSATAYRVAHGLAARVPLAAPATHRHRATTRAADPSTGAAAHQHSAG